MKISATILALIVLVVCVIIVTGDTIKQGERFVVTEQGNGIEVVLDMQTGREFMRCRYASCIEIVEGVR